MTNNSNELKTEKCSKNELVFDRSTVLTSVTEDYGLVCDELFLQSIFNSLYLGGMFVGSFMIGMISDKFGRLKAMIFSIFLVSGSGILAVFVNNKVFFAFLRLTCGMGGMGCILVTAVIAAEETLPNYKIFTTLITAMAFPVGELILAFEAYFLRNWITLHLVAYSPMLVLLGLYFVVPESTRWLLAKGRIEEAKENIQKRAIINKKAPVPIDIIEGKLERYIETQTDSKPSFFDLFKTQTILERSLNMFLQWSCVTMVYYGLLFTSTSLSGDPYVNFTLVILAEFPGIFLYLKLPHIIGRRNTLGISQAVSAICCISGGLLTQMPSLSILQISLVMIGRLFAAVNFKLVFLYTAELFPTQIRSTAVGTCSSIARVGGIIAILMQNLKEIWPPMTMVIFGTLTGIAAILAFKLPETRNNKLPESIEEALELGQSVRRNKFGLILNNIEFSNKSMKSLDT